MTNTSNRHLFQFLVTLLFTDCCLESSTLSFLLTTESSVAAFPSDLELPKTWSKIKNLWWKHTTKKKTIQNPEPSNGFRSDQVVVLHRGILQKQNRTLQFIVTLCFAFRLCWSWHTGSHDQSLEGRNWYIDIYLTDNQVQQREQPVLTANKRIQRKSNVVLINFVGRDLRAATCLTVE